MPVPQAGYKGALGGMRLLGWGMISGWPRGDSAMTQEVTQG